VKPRRAGAGGTVDLRTAHVLLTGASGGIGRSVAELLAADGARVTLTARQAGPLAALARRTGGRVVVADLADPAGVRALLDQAGPVDVLIANAALPASGPVLDYDPADIDRAIDVNLRVPIQLARALAPAMVERGGGHLVFVSSLAGLAASPASALYAATKFGLRGFALGLRQDLHGTGVGVSVVLPGFVRGAGMFADSGATLPPGLGTRSPEQVARATIGAIVGNRAEVVVAPPAMALGAHFGGVFPGVAARFQRALGGDRIAGRIAEGQRDRR
jgi:short-subunit dehydrogenase